MKKALVVGGGSGIGLSLTLELLKKDYDLVYSVGKDEPSIDDVGEKNIELFKEKTIF